MFYEGKRSANGWGHLVAIFCLSGALPDCQRSTPTYQQHDGRALSKS